MEKRLFPLLLSWGGFLCFAAFAMAYTESFAHYPAITWLLQLIRLAFLLVAVLLLIRFLSFRRQKPWENLKEAYAQAAGQSPDIRLVPDSDQANAGIFLAWIGAALAGLALGLPHSLQRFGWSPAQSTDAFIWILAWIWTAKVAWLRAGRNRETLKMSLDDLRSKRGIAAPPIREYRPGTPRARLLFAAFFVLGMLGLAVPAYWRLTKSAGIASRAEAGICLDRAWKGAMAAYEKGGDSAFVLPKCGPDPARFRWTLEKHEGGMSVSVWEAEGRDAFGDGVPGNQGLRALPEGRWTRMVRR